MRWALRGFSLYKGRTPSNLLHILYISACTFTLFPRLRLEFCSRRCSAPFFVTISSSSKQSKALQGRFWSKLSSVVTIDRIDARFLNACNLLFPHNAPVDPSRRPNYASFLPPRQAKRRRLNDSTPAKQSFKSLCNLLPGHETPYCLFLPARRNFFYFPPSGSMY